ncbi:hypothetical protein KOR34_13600 [Posidoniimonas corsicana]|uniref:Uncharacterized protein n=1 Tax=Posidoniimonas corsicana TaxID=1938618 RepID=A0A5C5VCV7_9BACT|nr:hypothetical protein [Posidoniimonas corsicana]TWT36454.1 hypothetical protein KOR34_13600 [Posidoniimonas corsicana]
MRTQLACILLATAAALPTGEAYAQDQDLSIVINPRTGSASLRNDSGGPLSIDGYLLVAAQDTFDSVAWASLEDNATAGWLEGQANDQIISEVNLESSLSIAAGESIAIGSPYDAFSPSEIGQVEPTFDFTYSVEGVGVFPGEVEFSQRNNVVLVVDQATGEATLENQSEFDVSIDSYLVQSPTGVLDSGNWSRLANTVGGWAASPGTSTRIGEAHLEGATLLSANGGSLSLGSAVNAGSLTDESDLLFQFSIAADGAVPGRSLVGGVLFGPAAIVPDLPGDFNSDGSVDAADYTVWRDGLGVTYQQSDYDVWRSNYGQTAASGLAAAAQAAPEPGVSGLLAVSTLFAGASRRRSHRRARR